MTDRDIAGMVAAAKERLATREWWGTIRGQTCRDVLALAAEVERLNARIENSNAAPTDASAEVEWRNAVGDVCRANARLAALENEKNTALKAAEARIERLAAALRSLWLQGAHWLNAQNFDATPDAHVVRTILCTQSDLVEARAALAEQEAAKNRSDIKSRYGNG